ncbi:hypothetical protein [Clostridium boliviensis]|uniref:hypothetical protein n=1 Tax=Clostridium boliviensis TaxID=318465 RepID=UPI002964108D|nr:hypothetical protein [Clostridium boliviensis]
MEKTVHNNQIVINNFPHTFKNGSFAHIPTMMATFVAQLHGLSSGVQEERTPA